MFTNTIVLAKATARALAKETKSFVEEHLGEEIRNVREELEDAKARRAWFKEARKAWKNLPDEEKFRIAAKWKTTPS